MWLGLVIATVVLAIVGGLVRWIWRRERALDLNGGPPADPMAKKMWIKTIAGRN